MQSGRAASHIQAMQMALQSFVYPIVAQYGSIGCSALTQQFTYDICDLVAGKTLRKTLSLREEEQTILI